MSDIAIRVERIGKKYRIRHQFERPGASMKALLNYPVHWVTNLFKGQSGQETKETIWAVKDISFSIKHGESVGLIGRNGVGKSTLLKLIARITYPTEGQMLIYDRVSSLLEIGTGFNAELTGRDNIYLNGAFIGMKHDEIRAKFDEIVDFSEIEQFIDTPVKYYSSGMFVRLAFSVAAHLTPEILLLDEILAVGDAAFQEKSKRKMKELINSGATIIFVSHSEEAIREICQRVLYLKEGRLVMDGPTDDVMNTYLESLDLVKTA